MIGLEWASVLAVWTLAAVLILRERSIRR